MGERQPKHVTALVLLLLGAAVAILVFGLLQCHQPVARGMTIPSISGQITDLSDSSKHFPPCFISTIPVLMSVPGSELRINALLPE